MQSRAFAVGIGVLAGLVIERFRSKPTENVNLNKEEGSEVTAILKLGHII